MGRGEGEDQDRDPGGTRGSRSNSTCSAVGRPRLKRARSRPAWDFPTGCSSNPSGRSRVASVAGLSWPACCSRARRTLILDEPTNHLDADSIAWLRSFLRSHDGGLMVISHDGDLLESVVNKVFHLDATRGQFDVYRLGWKAYLEQLATDERRRRREREQRRAQSRRAEGAGRPDARQGDQGEDGRTTSIVGRRALPTVSRMCAAADRVGEAALPCSRSRAGRPRSPRPGSPSPTDRSRCSRASISRSTAAAVSSSSG